MKKPRVSIVIPTYNRAALLRRCLESLRLQTYRDFEVIVCDDGSQDNSKDIALGYATTFPISYLPGKNSGGPATPRNRGISKAKGEFIAFLDSDDWWLPEKLKISVAALDTGADLVYHGMYLSPPRFFSFRKQTATRDLSSPVFKDLLENGNSIANSSVVIRKTLVSQIGRLDEKPEIVAWEDYDYWLRAAMISEKFLRIKEPLGHYWRGVDNISNAQRLIMNIEAFGKKYKKFLGNPGEISKGWTNFALAQAYRQIGDLGSARTHLRNVVRGKGSLTTRIRALIRLIICSFKR